MTESETEPTPAAKRAALDELLKTRTFERSTQLQSFLRFVCEREIEGRAQELSEQVIGVHALGRPSGYSPAEDSVVRRRAIDLREKLEEVYAGELAASPLRIELPKGRYVPRFVRVARRVVPAAPPAAPLAPRGRSPSVRALVSGAFVLGLVVGGGAALVLARRSSPSSPAVRPERGTSHEAEAAENQLSGMAVRDRCEACSGGARVRNVGRGPAHHVTLSVTAEAAGPRLLTIHYLLSGDRSLFVSVNRGAAVELPLRGDSWTDPANVSIVVTLRQGPNEVRLFNDEAVAPDLDRVVVF